MVALFFVWVTVIHAASKPNVLVLFTDDQRADTIAGFGNPDLKTPHLDRLARSGLAFRRAYMMGALNGATCVPSRAMLLSGRSLFRIDENLERDETWPAAFGKAGYTTFITGKWHSPAASVARSFQKGNSIFVGGMVDPMKAKVSDLVEGRLTEGKQVAAHSCSVFADEAIRFIRQPKESPFFCYVAFNGPHDPHIVPPEFHRSDPPRDVQLKTNVLPVHPFDNGEMVIRDERLLPWPRTEERLKNLNAEYYRYVEYIDAQIGRVLDALAGSPHSGNTIVVFASDSGVARGSHGLIGKQNLYEHSVGVPLVMAGPGIPAGKSTDALCYLFDVMPTLGGLCGVAGPSTSEGRDLGKTIHEPSVPARSELLLAYTGVQRAIVNDRWKFIRYPIVDQTQLFDLRNDPYELTNCVSIRSYERIVGELLRSLEKLQTEFGDAAPLSIANPASPFWKPPEPVVESLTNQATKIGP